MRAIRRVVLILGTSAAAGALIAPCCLGASIAIDSADQKAIVVRLCTKAISDYSAFIAGRLMPRNIVALEREYQHCAEIISEYEDRTR